MKPLLIFIGMIFYALVTACSDGGPSVQHVREYEISKEGRQLIHDEIGKLYQDVTSCDLLGKCLGYKKGEISLSKGIISYTWAATQNGYSQQPVYGAKNYYTCKFGKREIALDQIGPMYEGCTNKKCGTDCDLDQQ